MTYIVTQPERHQMHVTYKENKTILSRFFQWAADEDRERHIVWVGGTITAMAAVFFPLTMSVVRANGASFGLIIAAMVSLSIVVVANLAAMPTRYTIPLFFLGILIDAAVIITTFVIK